MRRFDRESECISVVPPSPEANMSQWVPLAQLLVLRSSFPSILPCTKCSRLEHWGSSNFQGFFQHSNNSHRLCPHSFTPPCYCSCSSPQMSNFICPMVSYALILTLRWIQCLKGFERSKFTLTEIWRTKTLGVVRQNLSLHLFSPLRHTILPNSSMKEDQATNQSTLGECSWSGTDLDADDGKPGLSGRFGCRSPALSKLLVLLGGIGFLGGTWGACGFKGFWSKAPFSSDKGNHVLKTPSCLELLHY